MVSQLFSVCVFDLLLGGDSLMAILNNSNYKHSISKACTGWIDCHIEIHSHYQYLRMGRAGGYPNYKVDAPLKLF